MITVHPVRIKGAWAKGFSLDQCSDCLKRTVLDPVYDFKNNPLIKIILEMKNGSGLEHLNELTETVSHFIRLEWNINELDWILPVPPARERPFQLVNELVREVAERLPLSFACDIIKKVKDGPEIKSLSNRTEKKYYLKDTFALDSSRMRSKNILLIDDVLRTKETLNYLTRMFYQGGIKKVNVLTLICITDKTGEQDV
ncbi:MAG: hypothetical protein JW827_01825 [Spirochaetes bacterium]|nr:hypothetical protein [Spirochaetota bacterium]